MEQDISTSEEETFNKKSRSSRIVSKVFTPGSYELQPSNNKSQIAARKPFQTPTRTPAGAKKGVNRTSQSKSSLLQQNFLEDDQSEEETVLNKKSGRVSTVSTPGSFELQPSNNISQAASVKISRTPRRTPAGVKDDVTKTSKSSTKPSLLQQIFPEDDL